MNEDIKAYLIFAIVILGMVLLCMDGCNQRLVELEKFKIQHNVK